MNKKLMCLILGICLLLCIYLINLPLHKTTDDFDGKNIILYTQLYTRNPYALNEYKDLYLRNEDIYARKEILEKVSITKSVLNPKARLFFIKRVITDKIPLKEETFQIYISDLKYFGKYDEALEFAKSVNIDKSECHNYKSTVWSITQCKVNRMLLYSDFYLNDTLNNPFLNYTLQNAATNTSSWETFYNNHPCKSSFICFEVLDLALNDLESYKIRNYRPCAFVKLGELYMMKKDYKKAILYFEMFLKEFNVDAKDAEYKLNEQMAKCYEKIGDKKNAEKHKKIMKELSTI